jgi:PAS domain S-box-containing protein
MTGMRGNFVATGFEAARPPNGRLAVILSIIVMALLAAGAAADEPPPTEPIGISVGSELEFPPYSFLDSNGHPTGFSVDLILAVADTMGLRIQIVTGTWDVLWSRLVSGQIAVLPIVAKMPDRQQLVDFGLPHTETYDAFFVRRGEPELKDLASARGKEIVVMRSDAAHHKLMEHQFDGTIVPVETIPEGLTLVSSGKHDAFLCSKLIGTEAAREHRIGGLTAGPPIPDYKRAFSFAVRKGEAELLEKLNQGLLIIKTNGEYERIYNKWLYVDGPWGKLEKYLWPAAAAATALGLIAAFVLMTLERLVARRTRELAERNQALRKAEASLKGIQETLEQRVAARAAELAESETRYRSLFTSMTEGFALHEIITDADGKPCDYRFLEINPAFERLTGMEREAVVGKTVRAVIPTIEGFWIETFGQVALEGTPARFENYSAQLNRWYRVFAYRPAPGQFATVFADITEQKLTEEALRQSREDLDRAQSVGQIGWWRLDTRRNVLMWSAENHRIFGVPEGTPMSYEFFLSIVHPDDRQYVDVQWQAGLRGEPYDIEHRIVADGRVKWVREKAYLEFDNEGKLLGGFGITQDITERKQAQEALLQLNETLEQQVTERTFDLNRTIEVLKEEIELREQAEKELQLANEQLAERADQLRRLTSELTMAEQAERKRLSKVLHDGLQQHLVSAKLQIGGVAEQIGDVDLRQAVDEIEKMLGESVRMSRSLSAEICPPILYEGSLTDGLAWLGRWMREKHNFRVDLAAGAVPELSEDVKVLVFESVRELLFNALKHAGVSRAGIQLKQAAGGELRVTVSDEGAGFDPGRLRLVGGEGGFGLFSVRERIGLSGGRLEIDSAPGKGSRLALIVPPAPAAARAFAAEGASAQIDSSPRGATEDRRAKIRILLADDHGLFRNGLARLLEKDAGLDVVGEARDGREAIELAQKLRPDVILMDISMPNVNGVDATRAIHREYPEIRIIGLSMHADQDYAQAILDAGAIDYKSKGCPAAELIAAIRASVATRPSSAK